MKNSSVLQVAVVLAALVSGPALTRASEVSPSQEERSLQIERFRDHVAELHTTGIDSGSRQFAESVSQHYERVRQIQRPITSLSDQQILDLFRAATTVIFYTNDARYLPDITSAFEQLHRRSQLSEKVQLDMRSSLIRVRALDQLKRLSDQGLLEDASDVAHIQQGVGVRKDLPLLVRAGDAGDPMRLENYIWPKGLSVVVVYGPHCAPSRKALTAISGDKELATFFQDRALWLMPVDDDLHVQALGSLAKNGASSNVAVAYNRASWPQIESWTTPMFYFFDDGSLVRVVKGWQSDAQLEVIRQFILARTDVG
ncbi:hypothetical protein [Pseudoxanthomonas mexicana]|uniref:hypothetical protein n=1 Tax=Pseudoxanthomonas mexicana TaxID=128785 RepID=UPI0028A2B1AD|nr:hypothetical protein [Pseudoxanthomonas mexicana]